MARTTADLVGGIIEVDAAITLTPFIDIANAMVTQCCTNLSTDYIAAHLIQIETWLAAHFYTVRDMRVIEERAGPVSERKQSKVDLGFSTSHYGQTAMRLDFYGGLATLDKKILNGKRAPSMSWLGKTESERKANPLNP